ncbi:ATP-binding domain-containing protein [Pseudomonadota bacterium]
MSEIRQYLRPDFDRIITRSSTIRQSEEKLLALTNAQYDYLDIADINDRALVEGAAGTGKTLLAIEYARREAAKFRSVLFVCFNRTLAEWLDKQFSGPEKQYVTVGSYHSIIRRLVSESSYKQEFEEATGSVNEYELFSETLPFYVELALNERGPVADTLIIDEAQDLIVENNVPVLNLLVTGGLAGGRWAIFGDFTRQAIYQTSVSMGDGDTKKRLLDSYCERYPTIPLRVNCRNTTPIGEETALLSGFDSLPYRLSQTEGLAVDYRYFKTREDEQQQLQNSLTTLLDHSVDPQDIVVLSPIRLEKSAAAQMQAVNNVPISDLRDIRGEPGPCIIFSTIHAFKGMESPAIVLCGISDFKSPNGRSLLYVGMSRARSHLIVVAHEKLKAALPELMKKRLSESWQ